MIFDSFPSLDRAVMFSKAVARKFDKKAHVCKTRRAVDKLDLFPFRVKMPAVLVEREDTIDYKQERQIEEMAREFGGIFAGT